MLDIESADFKNVLSVVNRYIAPVFTWSEYPSVPSKITRQFESFISNPLRFSLTSTPSPGIFTLYGINSS